MSSMTSPQTEKGDLEAIIEKSVDGILVVDSEGMIRFINSAASTILNRRREELLGEPFEYSVREGQAFDIDIKRRNGKTGTGEVRAAGIEWNGRNACLVSIRDITERIVYDRLKDEWIHNVSHELRTPLTSMRESMSLLYDGVLGEINGEQKNFLAMCLRNADHLKRILNNILDISKIEAKKVRFNKKKCNLTDVVRSAVEVHVSSVQNKGLEFRWTAPEMPVDVYADSDSIVQVINNLVGNALKFTEKGHIAVDVSTRDSVAECRVMDTGVGIASDDLPKVFDKFQQFGIITNHESKGTGLGLSISKEIIQLHAGTITVDSVLGRGSTFTFLLPRHSLDLEAADQIRTRLDSSKEPFILFSIRLNNPSQIDESLRSAVLPKTVHQIRRILGNSGKKTVPILVGPEKALLLIEAIHERDFKPKKEILHIVKESFLALGTDTELHFAYGIAHHPKDGQTAGDLQDATVRNTVDETAERLNKTILIVDDEKELTEATRTLLGLFGYQNILTANNGPTAFERLQSRLPDLIILDMKMPGMSGYEIIGRLKENLESQDIPILIMSGYEVETGRFHEYISKKAILTISKPVDGDLLRKMVYYLL